MLAEAQRSIISTRYNKALSRAFLSRARSANSSPSQVRFAVADQVMHWRGNNKRKSQWSMRWLGPGIVLGHEGRANVWIGHRNPVVKAAGNHVRLAEVEEQLPRHDLHDSLRDTDEQTYFDLCPLGVSRDPDPTVAEFLVVCTSAQSTSALALRCLGTPYATDCFTCCVSAICAYHLSTTCHPSP